MCYASSVQFVEAIRWRDDVWRPSGSEPTPGRRQSARPWRRRRRRRRSCHEAVISFSDLLTAAAHIGFSQRGTTATGSKKENQNPQLHFLRNPIRPQPFFLVFFFSIHLAKTSSATIMFGGGSDSSDDGEAYHAHHQHRSSSGRGGGEGSGDHRRDHHGDRSYRGSGSGPGSDLGGDLGGEELIKQVGCIASISPVSLSSHPSLSFATEWEENACVIPTRLCVQPDSISCPTALDIPTGQASFSLAHEPRVRWMDFPFFTYWGDAECRWVTWVGKAILLREWRKWTFWSCVNEASETLDPCWWRHAPPRRAYTQRWDEAGSKNCAGRRDNNFRRSLLLKTLGWIEFRGWKINETEGKV